jgi:DNA invertase Pin-like site-specific DNA recombinase
MNTKSYLKNTFKTAHVYSRVSSEKKDSEGLSLDSQENEILSYLRDNKYPMSKIFSYQDVGSAYTKHHSKLRDLSECLTNVSVNNDRKMFIVYDISRLSRNLKNALELFEIFEKHNVSVYSLHEQLWYNNSDFKCHKFSFVDKVTAAEKFSFDLSNKIKRSVRMRRRRGDEFGQPPIGKESYYTDGGVRKFRDNKKEKDFVTSLVQYIDKNTNDKIENKKFMFRNKLVTQNKSYSIYTQYYKNMKMNDMKKELEKI